MEAAMRKIYLEREALGQTLSDTSGLVQNVGVMFGFVLGTIALFVSLGIFHVDIASLWLLVRLQCPSEPNLKYSICCWILRHLSI